MLINAQILELYAILIMYNQSNAITCLKPTTTISTMAASTFIKIIVEMLKNSKIIVFKEKIIAILIHYPTNMS
jgi:hypothetical protein